MSTHEPISWDMLPPLPEPRPVLCEGEPLVLLTESLGGKQLAVLADGTVRIVASATAANEPATPTDAQVDRCMALGVDLCP